MKSCEECGTPHNHKRFCSQSCRSVWNNHAVAQKGGCKPLTDKQKQRLKESWHVRRLRMGLIEKGST
jgi:hypothetical protein